MTPSETFTEGNLVAELFRDDDCQDPRDCDGHFLWLGFPHRRYEIGDEQIDPGEIYQPCEACEGRGHSQAGVECGACRGEGEVPCNSLDELCEEIGRRHEALWVFPTEMMDHSGTAHYLHSGTLRCRWDAGISGLMVFTKTMAEEWGCPTDEAEIRQQMTNELDEYTAWCNGDCWGYRIRLSDDYEPTNEDCLEWQASIAEGFRGGFREYVNAKYGPDDSCWGFVGFECAESEAIAALHHHQPKETAA